MQLEEEEEEKEQAETARGVEMGEHGVLALVMAESYLRDQTELSYPPDAFADWRTAV